MKNRFIISLILMIINLPTFAMYIPDLFGAYESGARQARYENQRDAYYSANQQFTNIDNWITTGVISQIDGSKFFINSPSVRINKFRNNQGYYLTLWEKRIYPQNKFSNGKAYIDSTKFMYYDCTNKKYNFSDIYYYNNQGIMVHYETANIPTNSSKNWYRVAPNSVGDLNLNIICKFYNMIK